MSETLFFEILILSGVATLVATACSYVKLPTIIGFIFTGLMVGPNGLGLLSNLPNAYSLTELAGIILMFTIGLEFSLAKLRDLRQQFFRLGMTQVLITIAVIIGLGLVFTDYPEKKLVLWGFLISLSSTALVLKLLHDYRDFSAPHGQNSLGILLFQDIAVIPMMLILPFLTTDPTSVESLGWGDVLTWIGKVIMVLAFVFYSGKFLLPFILEKVLKTRSQELFFFSIIFLCLGIGHLFHLTGLSLSLGAFVAGIMISESAFGHQTMSVFGSLRDTLLGIFFAAIGMLLDLGFIAENILSVVGLGLIFFLIKVVVVLVICRINRIPLPTSIQTALTVCQVGEFSFLIVSRSVELNILDATDNQYFLAISVLSMMFTPFVYLIAPRIAHSKAVLQWGALSLSSEAHHVVEKLEETEHTTAVPGLQEEQGRSRAQAKGTGSSHTIVIGFGIAGHNVVEALTSLDIPYEVIDMNYDMVKKWAKQGFRISFGDASKRDVLHHAGLETAKMVVIAVSSSHATPHIVRAIRELRPDIPILVRVQYVRDVRGIKTDPRIELVVAEIETATELVANVLRVYGVDSETTYNYTVKARTDLKMLAELSSGHRYRVMSLPSWDALASIRPFTIDRSFYANGKTLAELALPRRTGASIVSVFRSGIGTTVPTGDFMIHDKDVIHVIAAPETFAEVEVLLRTGQ